MTEIAPTQEKTLPLSELNKGKINVQKAIDLRLKGLSYREIAAYFGVKHSSVYAKIRHLLPDNIDVQAYKNNRADVFAGKQAELLNALTSKKQKDMSGLQAVTALGILYDKERLERGQSTSNIAYKDMSNDINDIEAELAQLDEQLDGGE